jgi:hypothetical protein
MRHDPNCAMFSGPSRRGNAKLANFTLSPSPVPADGVPKCLLQDELASPNVLAT